MPDLATRVPPGAIDIFGDGIGFVRLVKQMGTELDIANAARVSFARESEWERNDSLDRTFNTPQLKPADKGLINFLLANRHGTPFEQGFIAQWHVRAPLAVFYEWHRHRVGFSYNEESARYVQLRGDFYHPRGHAIRGQVGKPGAYKFEPISDSATIEYVSDSFAYVYHVAYDRYVKMVERGVAKELARLVLPVGIYKEQRVVCNARSLMHFLSLRAAPDAYYEIRRYGEEMETIFAEHMPNVYQAFLDAGRISP